jgi:hypothetical protein
VEAFVGTMLGLMIFLLVIVSLVMLVMSFVRD